MSTKPVYKTWIRTNKLIAFLLITLFLILISLLPVNLFLRVSSGILSLPFLYISFLLSYSFYQFTYYGGDLQSNIHNLIVSSISWNGNGKVLDIGTGSACLIIKLAKAFPKTSLVGIDFWGEDWEYSKKLCEMNAEIEGVIDRVKFVKASASKIPFEDNEFDVVVSCLTFHEVKDESNKIEVLKEALRVMKQDGEFVFLDLFHDKKVFGEYVDFLNAIKTLGISEINVEKLEDMINLPYFLLNKKVLGNAMVIKGRK